MHCNGSWINDGFYLSRGVWASWAVWVCDGVDYLIPYGSDRSKVKLSDLAMTNRYYQVIIHTHTHTHTHTHLCHRKSIFAKESAFTCIFTDRVTVLCLMKVN